jgi:alkyl sulfatase BDS1-like metallo-beta-lactamase superfamily hydrolase
MSMPQLFDSIAVRLRSEDVGGMTTTIGLDVHDLGEVWTLGLAHRALHYRAGMPADPDVTVRLTRADFVSVVTLDATFAELVEAGRASIDDDRDADHRDAGGGLAALDSIFANLDTFMSMFPLVEP